MVLPNIYCSFCGVVILADSVDEPQSLGIRRPWYSEARAIFTHGSSSDISLSGIGILRHRSVLDAPPEPDTTYRNAENLEPIMLLQNLGTCWGFGFHDACWEIFVLRLGEVKGELDDVIQHLFIQFVNTPFPGFSSLDFGHDYGGAASTHKSWGLPRAVDSSSPFYADPNVIPSFQTLERTAPPACLAKLFCRTDVSGGRYPRQVFPAFGKLSPELVYEIFSYLSYRQLAKLRLACRDIAWKTRPDQLPQSYWKRQFSLDQELGFMYPAVPHRSTMGRDWFRAYWGTKSLLRAGDLSLANRKRIWDLIEPIATLVESDLLPNLAKSGNIALPSKEDQNYSSLTIKDLPEDASGCVSLVQSFSGHLSPQEDRGPLEKGSRVLESRAVSFPSRDHQNGMQIKIFGLLLGARVTLSGLSFSRTSIQAGECRLGICDTPTHWTVEVPSHSSIKSIMVAFDSTGLVGMKFLYKDGASSTWAGTAGQSPAKGVAFGILHVPSEPEIGFLLAGFDVGTVGIFLPRADLLTKP